MYEYLSLSIHDLRSKRGSKAVSSYFNKCNPLLKESTFTKAFIKEDKDLFKLFKLLEIKPKWLLANYIKYRLVLLYRLSKGRYPEDYYDATLIPPIEYCLLACERLFDLKEGDKVYTDKIEGGRKYKGFSFPTRL